MTGPTTHTLDVPDAVLAYDVREAVEPRDHRPLFVFGSPMGASGFEQLVSHFGDRTVITYDPRGMNRSTRTPGSDLTAETSPPQAAPGERDGPTPRTTTGLLRRRASLRWTPSGRAAAGSGPALGGRSLGGCPHSRLPRAPRW